MKMRYGNNGNYARYEVNSEYLTKQFGYEYAVRIFGQDVVDTLPKYVRGKNKGKPKGMITWRKAIKGGWESGIGVIPKNHKFAHGLWETKWGEDAELLYGHNSYCKHESKFALGQSLNGPAPVEKPQTVDYDAIINKAVIICRELGDNVSLTDKTDGIYNALWVMINSAIVLHGKERTIKGINDIGIEKFKDIK